MKNRLRFFALAALFALVFAACAKPPIKDLEKAEASLEAVAKAGGELYAKAELRKLADELMAVENDVSAQGKRLFKSYGNAKEVLAKIQAGAEALLPVIEVRKEIAQKYPLSTTYYLGRDDKLVTSISDSWAASSNVYSYGGTSLPDLPVQEFSCKLEGERLSPVLTYFLMLGSAGEAQVELEFLIRRGKETIVLAGDKFKVATSRYTSYFGSQTPKSSEVLDGDVFALRIRPKGQSFGIQFGPNASMVTFLSPRTEVTEDVLNRRAELIDWVIKNNKFGAATPLIYNVYRNIDDLILSKKNGSWNFGKGLTKSGNPYALDWTDDAWKVEALSEAQAKEKEVGDDAMTFTRHDEKK